MTAQPFRNREGGLIDRARPIHFTFNGRGYQGYPGDTLASALLANGVHLVGRSFKYHRPRGIFAAGAEEPNALVQLGTGARTEPNMRATQVELFSGLAAASQNCWPSVDFDVQAVTGWLSRLMPSGFYYKTFMWPAKMWMTYERVIRNAAGMGRAPTEHDPDRYDHRHAHADVLVAGGGPAGLMAALAAARAGARVLLADEGRDFGGGLRGERTTIDGIPAMDWVARITAELAAMETVTLLPRTTVAAYYDHNTLVLAERVTEHESDPDPRLPRQRLWQVRAGQVILATGAIERPLVFAGNDRPGIMLASAARTYVNQYAVRPGRRAVVFANNSSAYTSALDLAAAGVEVAAIVDVRESPGDALADRAREAGIECLPGHAVVATRGAKRIGGVTVMRLNAAGDACTGPARAIACDTLCVSGGWNPTVHLFSQSRGRLAFADDIAAFVPDTSFQAERSAGAAKGTFTLAGCLLDGAEAGAGAARDAGFAGAAPPVPPSGAEDGAPSPSRPLWAVPDVPGQPGKRFVDLQNDVTTADLALAVREGYSSVEHLKRYTTLGMGTDQGRTSNVNGLAILAGILGTDIPRVGTTTFRPPYTPVTLGAIAGRETGAHLAPTRRSAMHDWHAGHGAVFLTAGAWLRPQYYPRAGETMWDAIYGEAREVRAGVGIIDVSTLGKIDIQGPDAAEFLNRLYINGWKKLAPGRCRYGVMLREDGLVFDDGTTTCLAENRYVMTTTTVHAGPIMSHIEYHLQVVWPELDVHAVSVTEEWAAIAVAGPASRAVLAAISEDVDMSNDAFPFMGYREGRVAGAPARLFRISFSGELAYEVNVPADWGTHVWEALMEAGAAHGITPYGMETMLILRVEKGHVVSAELNGRTSAADLGFGRMQSRTKDYIGRRALARPALADTDRRGLVGLVPADGATMIPRGAQIVADPGHALPNPMLGEVTSQCYSPNLGHPIALALLAGGPTRLGETLHALSPVTGERVAVTVTGPVFIDPDGERLRG